MKWLKMTVACSKVFIFDCQKQINSEQTEWNSEFSGPNFSKAIFKKWHFRLELPVTFKHFHLYFLIVIYFPNNNGEIFLFAFQIIE